MRQNNGVGRHGVVWLLLLLVSAGALAEKVSIVMPAYNAEKTIIESIDSVLRQTHDDWELIVVDDGSVDRTAAIAETYAQYDHRIRLVKLPENGGVGNARNAALPNVTGRYIAFLDSDDLWVPHKLERQLAFMRSRAIGFSFTSYRAIGTNGALGDIVRSHPPELRYEDLLRQNQIPLFTVMLDREIVGEFAFQTVYNEDFLLWLHFLKKDITAHLLDEDLGRLRRLPGSVSANKARAAKEFWIVLRRHEQVPLARAALYFVNYAAKSLLKYLIQHRTLHGLNPACPGRIVREAGSGHWNPAR